MPICSLLSPLTTRRRHWPVPVPTSVPSGPGGSKGVPRRASSAALSSLCQGAARLHSHFGGDGRQHRSSVADTSGWASLMNQDIRRHKSGQSAAWQCLMGVRGGATSTAHAETFPDLPPSSSTSRDSPSNRRSTRATCQAAIRNGGCELCNIYI